MTDGLIVTGAQTQLASPPADIAGGGGLVIVGYSDGSLAAISPVSRNQVVRGRVNATALAAHVSQVLLDQTIAAGTHVLVAGRFATPGTRGYSGFVQEVDPRSLRALRTWTYRGRAVQDLKEADGGVVYALLTDGTITEVGGPVARRATKGEQPSFFAPLTDGRFATVTRGQRPRLDVDGNGPIPLPPGSGPLAAFALPGGGFATLLADADKVLLVDSEGHQSTVPVPNLPYAGLVDRTRLLVVEANGTELVAISLDTHRVAQRVTLDQAVERVIRL